MIFSILIAGSLVVLSFPFKKSKLLTILFLFYIWLLWGWNYWNGDYEAYERKYDYFLTHVLVSNYEIGYSALMIISNQFGLEFQQFFQLISLFIIISWGRFILTFSKVPALYTTILFFVFFPLDYVLLRNTLAFAIVLQGLCSVLKDSKHKYLKYIICVLIASTIHSSAIFYLFLLIAFKYDEMDVLLIAYGVVLAFFFVVMFKDLFLIILGESSDGRSDGYSHTIMAFLFFAVIQIINFILIYYYCKDCIDVDREHISLIMKINLLLLFLIVLYFVMTITVRLFRNIAIVNTLFMLNVCSYYLKDIMKYKLLLIIYVLVLYQIFIHPVLDDTLIALYENNLIFE